MKITITGASGFIGRYLVDHFDLTGAQVFGIDRTISAPTSRGRWYVLELPSPHLKDMLRELQPEVLIHAAGTASVGNSIKNPYGDFQQSVEVWAGVIDAVREICPGCRLIFISSAAVYGNQQVSPICESHPAWPISPYGHHKRMCEELGEYYYRLYGLRVCIVRIFSAYGRGLQRQVVWDICRKAMTNKTVELMGTGEEERDFIHAHDVSRAIDCLVHNGDFNAGIYNVASGRSVTIREVAECVMKSIGAVKPIVFSRQDRSGDPANWRAEISKISALGFTPRILLEDGLANYVTWFLQEGHRNMERQ